MDFLDPKRRKAHRRRLFLGYALMAVLVIFGTMVVLYLAYGFDIDRKTGQVIQNGIVFVDSKPKGAKVFLNEVEQRNRTDSRLALPAGVYTVRIELEGYRTWERTFNLEGGAIQRLVYPYLIPNQFATTDVASYDTMPLSATQSPDRRWVLVQRADSVYQYDVFDLNDPDREPTTIVVPPTILTDLSATASVEVIEWSTDNRHLILKRSFEDNTEFLLLDREKPAESININTVLGIAPASMTLKNKRPDQFYYLDAQPGVLRSADIKNRTISAPLLNNVSSHETYGDDLVLYVTTEGVEAGKAEVRILEGDKIYTLKQVTAADSYIIEVSKYDDEWYYVAGSSADNLAFVYKNPLPVLKQQARTPLAVTAIMRLDNPRFTSFSANTQFISVQSGNKLLTLDLEDKRQYRIELEHDIPANYEMTWMDGHRFVYTVDQQSYIVDFDGSNDNTLVTSRLPGGPFFDRDYDNVFTFEESKSDGNKKAFTMTVIED